MSPRVRQILVLLSAILAVVVSTIGSGAFGGTPIAEASGGALSDDATLLAPAGPAFSIWSLIYGALIVLAIVQALPRNRDDDRLNRVAGWTILALLLNPAWILVVQAGVLWLTVAVIAALAAVLIRIALLLSAEQPRGAQKWWHDLPLALYAGWVIAATAANTAAFVDAEITEVTVAYALVLLVVATFLSTLVAMVQPGGAGVAAATAWGAAWIAYGRLTGDPESTVVAVAAVIAAVWLAGVAVLRLVRPHIVVRSGSPATSTR
ncbi:hypothetical protein [Nocardioides massiliensis]|uniref:Tryptophan-rich sensory protein n=1 Tax=Nocardioides massiliensis TaxID=1325935 RepID=A0ABT9NJV1_9ACTN|nr:hypothetical protein [Nocardioides massiliensis]MDP9820690.1 hypothetical protein [Nocardioides massiliensis]